MSTSASAGISGSAESQSVGQSCSVDTLSTGTTEASRETLSGSRKPSTTGTYKPEYGCVYILKCGEYFKIGMTTNTDSRRTTIALQIPFAIEEEVSFAVMDVRGAEADLHAQFSGCRMNGEWFRLSPEQWHNLRDSKVLDLPSSYAFRVDGSVASARQALLDEVSDYRTSDLTVNDLAQVLFDLRSGPDAQSLWILFRIAYRVRSGCPDYECSPLGEHGPKCLLAKSKN